MRGHYDVYIKSKSFDEPLIRNVRATDPDDAIDRCESSGDFVPSAGDRVIRCILVNTDKRPESSMHGRLA